MSFKKFLMLLALPVAFMVSGCEDPTPNTDSILPECEIVDANGAAINTINLPAEQSEATFTITANRAWSAAVTLVDWFAVTPYSQPNPDNKSISTEVKITAFANTSSESREAVIDITVDGIPTPIKLTVKQLGVGQVATGKTIYYDNFDKVVAVKDGNYWPYMSAEYGNPTPENQTGVTYNSKNVTARANSASNGEHSDYEGSGGNNMFFGKENHLTISGISLAELEGNAMTITFGTEKYVGESEDNTFKNEEFLVYISGDGTKWSPITYSFTDGANLSGKWNLATAQFNLKEVPSTISLYFASSVASTYRLDDVKIIEGGGGAEIDLSQGGDINGGDNNVINPDPNAQAISVADFIAKADSNTTYQLTGVISGSVNTTYGNFDLVDESGSIYIYGLKDGETGQNLNWSAKGLNKGDNITIQGKYYLYEGKDGSTKHEIVDALYISHSNGEDPEPPVVIEGDFGSDAAFVCASDDSTNAAYGLGDTQIGGKPASGFKLGKSKQEGKFTSAAIGVSGDKYLNFYAVSWGAGGDKTIYFRVNGGEVKSQDIKANEGATGNAPYNNIVPTDADHYSILLSGLTATDKIEFSTNADFALTTHAGSGNDYASRVIFFGVKLTDEAIGNTGGDNTGGDNTGDDNTGGSTGEIQTLTVKDFLAKGVDANVWYKLTGKITNIANTTYGNFDLVDESGSVYVYGLTATQQSSNDQSFSSLGLKEGDIVTLIGVRAVYNDSPQVGNAYYVSHVEGETPEVDANVATISFADAANRTTLTKTQQVWQQNGITVTGDKASSTTDVADYSGPARFYKGSNLTIAAEKEMSQIVINTTGGSKYYFTLSDGSGYTVSGSGTSKATITLTTPAKSFTITGLANQVRCTSIEVTFAE